MPQANDSDDTPTSDDSLPAAGKAKGASDAAAAGTTGDHGCIRLPELVDFTVCEDLAARIGAARHSALEVDAEKVTFLGTLGLQLLLSAHAQWQRDKAEFTVSNPSSGFLDGLKELGVSDSVFDS
tara:strand:+ start:3851 stop:4225 length:375 start_codon:yes stop_codon:yes gene_type:complete